MKTNIVFIVETIAVYTTGYKKIAKSSIYSRHWSHIHNGKPCTLNREFFGTQC